MDPSGTYLALGRSKRNGGSGKGGANSEGELHGDKRKQQQPEEEKMCRVEGYLGQVERDRPLFRGSRDRSST